jgi:hypothetical protein
MWKQASWPAKEHPFDDDFIRRISEGSGRQRLVAGGGANDGGSDGARTEFRDERAGGVRNPGHADGEQISDQFPRSKRSDGGLMEIPTGKKAMSDQETKFPEWQTPLEELREESDPNKLLEKAQNVETLILERLKVVFQGSDGRGERAALAEALHTLRVIKRDKLGFPDWQ